MVHLMNGLSTSEHRLRIHELLSSMRLSSLVEPSPPDTSVVYICLSCVLTSPKGTARKDLKLKGCEATLSYA